MPFTKAQTEDRSELRDLVYGWGKIVTRRAGGVTSQGPLADVIDPSAENPSRLRSSRCSKGRTKFFLETTA
jgi:hypothetical protein